MYSIHNKLRIKAQMLKKSPLDKVNGTKNALFFLSRDPAHQGFTFNLRFLYELKHESSVKPLFPNKIKTKHDLKLFENGSGIINKLEIVNTFNNYLTDIVQNLRINLERNAFYRTSESERVKFTSKLFERHPSITSIKKIVRTRNIIVFFLYRMFA